MNNITHLALRTGYSFKHIFGHIDKTMEYSTDAIGIADNGNTFAHPVLEQKALKKNVKPIFSVRLTVVKDATEKVKPRGQFGPEYIFIAKNESGLEEIYNLVRIFYENFYYRGNISQRDVFTLSEDVIVIAENFQKKKRIDYIALTTTTPKMIRKIKGIPKVAIINNYYPEILDHEVYDIFTRPRENCNQTYPQHILSTDEWLDFNDDLPEKILEEAINNTIAIAESCDVTLTKAPMIKYHGKEKIEFLCKIGAKKKGIDLSAEPYKSRYEFELKLIKEKDFVDYFLVVAEMVSKAKKKTLVGPSRGSAAGSLICYLTSITEIDPLEYDLLFERFIDINRNDFPDIDIDFPDTKRESVIKELIKEYGSECVKHIANISTMQPRIAINEFQKSLCIPPYETEAVKENIIERFGGHERANLCMLDTFETTEVGREFIEKFPAMKTVSKIENHPRHSSVHAAGIIVCNDPVSKFVGVNARDNTAMVDKKTAEYLNLLKIDVLGLRTLSILEDCAKQVGMNHLDFYKLPLDNKETFSIFNDMRVNGIFQFEGDSVMNLTRKMGIHEFGDITALTALARPGALHSGGANRYIKYRLGQEKPTFISKKHKKITKETYSVVVYQEQILKICREIGGMDWVDVNALRKAFSKSLGKDYFNTYKKKFEKGAKKKGYSEDDVEFIWDEIQNSGEYAFNKSHAVAYALISYWCAYMKFHYPKEFLVASLNNAKADNHQSAIRILRDAVVNEGIEYIPIDQDESLKEWSVNSKGKVVGGLLNVPGIGPQSANKIISSRKTGEALPAGIISKMLDPVTPFDILFPTQHYWGLIYSHPENFGLAEAPSRLVEVQEKGEYLFIGKLIEKNINDLNSYENMQKRKGEKMQEHSLELRLKFEDDTGNIMGSIGRFDYERIGKEIAEESETGEDWFLIKGEIKYQSRFLTVQEIFKLDDSLFE